MKPRLRELAENLLCLALLAAVGAVARYPLFLHDAVPADLNALFSLQPWEEARPPDLTAESSSDAGLHFYPWYKFLTGTAARGASPLWNPEESCGIPFMALWATRVFSPFSLPFYFLPVDTALQFSALLKLLVAGWCAFYVARRLGFAPAPAFIVGIAFELSGAFLLWNVAPLSDTLPWLPLWILFLNRIAVGQYRYWPFGGVVLALMLTGGDPRAAAILVAFALLFLVFQHGKPWPIRPLMRAIVSLGFAVLLGVLLLGVQIVPYIEWLRESAPTNATEPIYRMRASDLLVLVFPHFFGRQPGANDPADFLYAGLVSVFLLALWWALRFAAPDDLRRRVEGLLATALVFTAAGGLLMALGVQRIHPRHFFVANDLIFGLVGAAAVEEWVELNADECKKAMRRFFVVALLLIAGVAIAVGARYADHRPDALALWIQIAVAAAVSTVFILLLIGTALKPSRRVMAYGAAAVLALELLVSYMPRMAHVPPALFFPETAFIASLRESDGRVGGGEALARWPLGMHGIAQMRGPRPAQSKRAAAFADRLQEDPLLLRRSASQTLLLTKGDIQGPFATARSSLRIRHILPTGAVVFEDLGVKPRVWVAYDWLSVPEGAPHLITAAGPPVVETTVAAPQNHLEAALRESLAIQDGNDHVVIQADLEQPGLLVLTDSFYPGWKGFIDKKETPILAVDSMFRGVEVGKGAHTIEFRYEPESVWLGLTVSLTGVGLFVAGLLFHGTRSAMRVVRARAKR